MFRHTKNLQFEAKPERPDPVFAHKLQELIGGAYGELTVTWRYLFQGWNCRIEGKYKDLILDTAAEEIGHVEMLATMVARLLEGAPATETAKAAQDPVTAAVLGGMDPQQAIVAGGGAMAMDSNGEPWNGKFVVASGNLLADFRANAAAEAQGRLQTARLYNMTDDPGVKEMLKFNLARDTVHQKQWLRAIEELQADGLEDEVAPSALFDEENQEHNKTIWHLSDGPDGPKGGWTRDLEYLMEPRALGGPASAPPPDPALFSTFAPAATGATAASADEPELAEGDVQTFYSERDGKWKNQVEGNKRASSTSGTKAEAQQAGRELAKDRGVTHVVRRKDGEVAEKHDYS